MNYKEDAAACCWEFKKALSVASCSGANRGITCPPGCSTTMGLLKALASLRDSGET